MPFAPRFTVTPRLLGTVEAVAELRTRILWASVTVPWIPVLQRDARVRNTHGSTAIEGNPLTLDQVRRLAEGRPLAGSSERSRREVLNTFAALSFIEARSTARRIREADVLRLHALIGAKAMEQGEAGRYRRQQVWVGGYTPPPPDRVRPLMRDLLRWYNERSKAWSPVISSAILHHRFEDIHPFADGNGRTGRALALWDLYRRGFDTHHIFSVDEYYWADRARHYRALARVRKEKGDLTSWIEYVAEGLRITLQQVWARIREVARTRSGKKIVLTRRQEELLTLLRDRGAMRPRELWSALKLSKQGAINALRPLLETGLVRREGTRKSGRYVLA